MRHYRHYRSALCIFACCTLFSSSARADVGWHIDLGASEAITIPQAKEFNLGGSLALRLDIPFSRKFAFVLGASTMVLSTGKAPSANEGLAAKAEGVAGFGKLGLLWHPASVDTRRGMWLQAAVGPAFTGDLTRASGSAGLGYAYPLGESAHIGPFAEYTYIFQPDDTLRPEDAHLATIGISLGFGPSPRDADKDKVYDSLDACPLVPGIKSEDPTKHGCPEELAPPPAEDLDPDKDGIVGPADACPDAPGAASEDPKKNGCPAEKVVPEDPDGDGIAKPYDACPGVAGIPSEDAKANGCPKADGSIHVEEDKIVVGDTVLFDTDSPRVRHRAWPTLQKVARFIKDNPDIKEVTVEGHADATGSEDYNMRLSLDRAMAVRRMLIKYGVSADAIQAESFGRSRLQVQTTRAEAKNRRVELWVTRSKNPGDGARR